MKDKIVFFAKGLMKGYGGGTKMKKVNRGKFTLDSSHFEEDGNYYHDEWAASRVGGGQEIIKVDGEKFTRIYAGGTISKEALQELGISIKDTIGFLKTQMLKNGERMRLLTDFVPNAKGDWRYEYKIIDEEENIPVITGKESIFYKDKLVFVHVLTLCPVE